MLSPEVRPASRAAALERRARHQRLDALVDVAEALLEPHHRLAVGGEAEMARLDDAGMHRPDRDLVQALALGRQEGIGRARPAALRLARRADAARPSSRDRARAARPAPAGLEPVEIADRALEPDRRRMQRADRRKASVAGIRCVTTAMSPAPRRARAMCTAPASPHRPSSVRRPAASSPATARQRVSRRRPRAATADAPRPAGPRIDVDERGHARYPSSFATFWNQATSAGGR